MPVLLLAMAFFPLTPPTILAVLPLIIHTISHYSRHPSFKLYVVLFVSFRLISQLFRLGFYFTLRYEDARDKAVSLLPLDLDLRQAFGAQLYRPFFFNLCLYFCSEFR